MEALDSFRERMARRDDAILRRVGDRATREDGSGVLGTFENTFQDPQLGAKGGSQRLAATINAEEIREPRFNLPVKDADGLGRGAALTIELAPADGGGRYKVLRQEPDGSGWVVLVLGKENERTADIT